MKNLRKIYKQSEKAVEEILNEVILKKQLEFDIESAVILGVFEDIVRKVDSLILLIDENKTAGLDSITRSIFENHVYLKLFLSNESSLYTRSYYLAHELRKIKLYDTVIASNKPGNNIRSFLGRSLEGLQNDFNGRVPDKLNLEKRFEDVLVKRKEKDNWYNLDGSTRTFEQLCRKLDQTAYYDLLYRILSNEVHATDALKRWVFEPGKLTLLNQNQDNMLHINVASTVLLDSLRDLYDFYNLRNQLKNFNALIAINTRLKKNKPF